MYINCEVILRWDATPTQYRALGAALWTWCSQTAGANGISQYLNNQPLADLLAGRLPHARALAGDACLPRFLFLVSADGAHDHGPMLETLRRALPVEAIADLRIDGLSWCQAGADSSRRLMEPEPKSYLEVEP
jgi:hypothetical protein